MAAPTPLTSPLTTNDLRSWLTRILLSEHARAAAVVWALLLAAVAVLTGVHGVDLAAATYRVDVFSAHGFTLWDSQWYGGHWLLNYSVLYAPAAALMGVVLTEILCVGVCAWAYDCLAFKYFGVAGRVSTLFFALSLLVEVAVGRGPYLLGEAVALLALLAATRGHWGFAWPLALLSTLITPLVGAFLALVAFAWLLDSWRTPPLRVAAFGVCAFAPIIVIEILFPGQGQEPFATSSFTFMLAGVIGVACVAALARERLIVIATTLYGLALIFAYALPSALGSNITRLGTDFGIAILICALGRGRRSLYLFALAAVPIFLMQWGPATADLSGAGSDVGVSSAYYQPLLRFLSSADAGGLGRVEVVPTAQHWESVYVATAFPLARGWERQLDTADNPIFYVRGDLTRAHYRAWLRGNGVRFVAVSDATPDSAGTSEARLLRAGVPGLGLAWENAHWRVYRVLGSPGIVSGDGNLLSINGDTINITANGRGRILVREHYSSAWEITKGAGTVTRSPGGWLLVNARARGRITLNISL